MYRRCGNAILQTLRETEQQKRQWDNKQQTVSKRVRIGHGISRLSIRKLSRYFENGYQHYKNLAAYEYAQRQIKWQQQQEIQEEEGSADIIMKGSDGRWRKNGKDCLKRNFRS